MQEDFLLLLVNSWYAVKTNANDEVFKFDAKAHGKIDPECLCFKGNKLNFVENEFLIPFGLEAV